MSLWSVCSRMAGDLPLGEAARVQANWWVRYLRGGVMMSMSVRH
jgi:hypothetical protein